MMEKVDIKFIVESSLSGGIIPYRRAFRHVTGSVTASILLQQMHFHWKNKGFNPFYKFKMPCSHSNYRTGDSWAEELGFTESELNGALGRIATKVNSKAEIYEKLKIKRVDHLIIVYRDRATNLTWYYLNIEAFYIFVFNALKKELLEQEEKAKTETTDSSFVTDSSYKALLEEQFTGISLEITNCHLRNPQLPVEKSSVPYNTKNTQRIHKDKSHTDVPSEAEDTRLFEKEGETYETKREVKEVVTQEQVHRVKTEIPKQRSLDQIAAIRDSKQGKVMPVDFQLSFAIIQEAVDTGFDIEDLEREFTSFHFHYTSGRGKRRKSTDWNNQFLHKWIADGYSYGKIKKHGKFYGTNPNQERLQSLQNTARRIYGDGGSTAHLSLDELLAKRARDGS